MKDDSKVGARQGMETAWKYVILKTGCLYGGGEEGQMHECNNP
jgi:hypothetical protein